MRITIVGASGQLGTELQRVLTGELTALSRAQLDLTHDQIDAALAGTAPDLVINTAAWNLVDRAEDEPQTAFQVNALGPRRLAEWCNRAGVPLVHISTDYVFSGLLDNGGRRFLPYRETDPPDPLSAYGVSKLAGEHFVRALCPEHLIVRTCGLYGRPPAGGKGNFVETMLRLGAERPELRVVDDQECTPTSAADLARMVAALIDAGARGTFHATNAGSTTWCGLARTIFGLAGMKVSVQPITTAEYGAKARRPGYSVLSTARLTDATGVPPRPWQDALEQYIRERR